MVVKVVPHDLLPVAPNMYTEEWAKQTYHHNVAFSSNAGITSAAPSRDELEEWIRTAQDIGEDLKSRGLARAKERIVHMMNTFFSNANDNRSFQNLSDVKDWFCLRESFYKDYNQSLDMLYMFQYGIFRCGYNAWALDEARRWMEEKNVSYEITKRKKGDLRRQGKGFVYKLLVSRASNSICARFQELTKRHYNEYIIVREKKKSALMENVFVETHIFNHSYDGYIVRLPDNQKISMSKTFSSEELQQLNILLKKAYQAGKTFDELRDKIGSLLEASSKGNNCIHSFINLK